MPIYEYRCETCGHCFEKLLFAGDEESGLKCPACGALEVRKQVSCVGVLGGAGRGLCSANPSSRFS
jgi:putative FmdB family regulatory protein